MGDIYLRKYGVATTVDFALYKLDGTGLKTDAASASGDITLYRDEAGVETLDADAFVDEGAIYSLALSATEMEAARIIVCIVDQTAPQVWLDKTLIVETYGNASAQHAFDLDASQQSVTVAAINDIDLSATMKASVATALLGAVIEGTLTAQQALKLITAASAGTLSGGGTNTLVFKDTTGTKSRITATVDANMNRTNIVTDLT